MLGSLLFCAVRLGAAEAKPDLSKLAAIPPGPALVAAAEAKQIPLSGIASPGDAGRLNPGDSFTAVITLCQKGGRRTQWLLYLRAVPSQPQDVSGKPPKPLVLYSGSGTKLEFAPSSARVCLRTIGPFPLAGSKPKKAQDKSDTFSVNKGFLGLGLDRAAALIWRRAQSKAEGNFWFGPQPPDAERVAEARKLAQSLQLTAEDERALAGMFPALFSYFDVVQHTEGLEDILWKVVDKPSVWSIVRHLGVTVNLALDSEHFAPVEARDWRLPAAPAAYAFPMRLELNGQLALRVTFVVTDPRPPLLSCGGIVGMLAEKPDDKQTYLTLRVVGAHLAQMPVPAALKPAPD